MNAETASQNPFPTSANHPEGGGTAGLNGDRVHKVAQTLHEAVDNLEQKVSQGSDRVMSMQQEYCETAREQVRANPLAALGVAFAAGFLISRIMR